MYNYTNNDKMFNDLWNELCNMGYDNKLRFSALWDKIIPFIHPDTIKYDLLYCGCDDIYCIELWDFIGVYELIQFNFDMNKIYLHDDIINYDGCEPDKNCNDCIDCFYCIYNRGYVKNGYIFPGI